MVRSHIGNVVCRKALSVRVASSPPRKSIRICGCSFSYSNSNSAYEERSLAAESAGNVIAVQQKGRENVMGRKQAVSYLSKDILLHIDMLEILKRKDTEILQASDRGVLLYNESYGVYMISAQDGQAAKEMLSSVRQPEVIVTHQNFCVDTVQKQFRFQRKTACHQAAYFNRNPLPVPESSAMIRPLDESYLPFLLKYYSLAGIVSVQERLESGSMFGAFLSGTLAGFAGTHAEGSMGLLEVLPEYRRQGIAVVLETFLANRFLAEGRVPFAQIIAGNTASLKLQQKLDFTVSEQAICWLE